MRCKISQMGQQRFKKLVVDLFDEHKIEKLSIEGGNDSKTKLSWTKDNGIKIEYLSNVLM